MEKELQQKYDAVRDIKARLDNNTWVDSTPNEQVQRQRELLAKTIDEIAELEAE